MSDDLASKFRQIIEEKTQDAQMVTLIADMATRIQELEAEVERLKCENINLRATVERAREAINFIPPLDQKTLDGLIVHSVTIEKLSLRAAARKNATTVGRVRGALERARQSLGDSNG